MFVGKHSSKRNLVWIAVVVIVVLFLSQQKIAYSVRQTGLPNDIEPAWSPDGQFITFVSDRSGELGLWLMNSDGSDIHEITPSGAGLVTSPSWSPDGQQIAFMNYTDGLYEIWITSIDGFESRTIRAEQVEMGLLFSGYAVWDRTGCCITVGGQVDGQADIWLVDIETLNGDNLTQSRRIEYAMDWSPDGNNLIFSAFDVNYLDNSLDLWNLDIADQTTDRLTENAEPDLGAAWSPNGEQIAFATDVDGSRDVWLMSADGSDSVNLTPDSTDFTEYSPGWSPDGCCIAFTSNRTSHYSIWVLDLNEQSLTNLTK